MRTLEQVEAEIASVTAIREAAARESDGLKISINSIFGKFGSKYSAFYDPALLLHVTLTGQLALLMLVERLEALERVSVRSANTDGVLVHALSDAAHRAALAVLRQWEADTALVLEEEYQRLVASQDVNNYLALGVEGKVKGKGVFATPSLSKNPVYPIVARAVGVELGEGVPVATTILASEDLAEFVAVRKANGGAEWRGAPFGSTCRWYTGHSGSPITYVKSGNRVANSEHAVLVNEMPEDPSAALADIDRDYYIRRARELLKGVGATPLAG